MFCRKIGPRSSVWAEPSIVDEAAYEFSETEQMILAAENICGPYVWDIYDILVLPPTFPYGGMENPCLTFVSPTLLVCSAVGYKFYVDSYYKLVFLTLDFRNLSFRQTNSPVVF